MPKAALRTQVQLLTRKLDEKSKAQATTRVCQILLAYVDTRLPELRIAGTAIFRSFSDEINLAAFEHGLLQREVPFQILSEKNQLQGMPALLIVPGIAFDHAGRRLGRGRGYYDRLLEQLRQSSALTIAIGIGYDHQLLDKVPTEPHDQRVDMLCMPSVGLIKCTNESSEMK